MPAVPVPLDAELQVAYDAYLAEEPDLAPMSLEKLSVIRAEVDAEVAALEDLSHGGRFTVFQPSVPGLDCAPEIPLLVCTPSGAPASRPVLYFIHGGGFYCSDHRTGLDQILETAERLGATLISVGYRLAPEHPYPAQINDAYAGLLWVADHADELGIDPERIVVTGSSAGGGLSAALALTVRDKGDPPARPAADCPPARRPQRQRLGPADGRRRILGPQPQRVRLELAARRRPGRS